MPALHAAGRTADNGLKIVIVGGFGVGKTTMVRSVSEIRPLNTEETMTRAGVAVDDARRCARKTTTTVAFDFGRITLDDRMVLYLFGAPGQERFWFLWDRLFSGTLGAVVLVDTRRLADSWYAIDRLEHHGTPFIVACNDFGGPLHTEQQVREALDLVRRRARWSSATPARRESSKHVLITLRRAPPRPVRRPGDRAVTPSPQTTPDRRDPPPVAPRHRRPCRSTGPGSSRTGRLYREMRREHGAVAPVLLDGDVPAWLVLGYRELHQVTGDPVLFSRDSASGTSGTASPTTGRCCRYRPQQPSILYTVGRAPPASAPR